MMTLPWRINVCERHLEPELMDRPGLEVKTHRVALRAIARINSLAFTHRTFWRSIRPLVENRPLQKIRVLDVACGSGDVAVRLQQLAHRAGLPVEVDGCDVSPTAVSLAQEWADSVRVPCRFFQFDVLKDEWPKEYDVITTSLFLHHLTNAQAVQVLTSMAAATRQLVLVNDLIRSQAGYLLARFGAPLLTRSPLVHFDAPTSVAGAFTPAEMRGLATSAGMSRATISNCWMSRMLLEWNKS